MPFPTQLAMRRILTCLSLCYFTVMLGTAIFGVTESYTGLPLWDSWHAINGFYLRAAAGDLSAWLEHGNEHRFVLSRLLYWVEMHFFGSFQFLLLCNFLLIGCLIALFWQLFKSPLIAERPILSKKAWLLLLCATLFSWVQAENLTWELVSHVYQAFAVPLAAFLCLARYLQSARAGWLWLAALLGAAATLTMANGILALPLMALWLLLSRRPRATLALGILGAVTTGLYFYGFENTPPHPNGMRANLLEHPLELLQFILIYFGSPVRHISNLSPWASSAALAIGLLFAVLTLWALWHEMRHFGVGASNALHWALLMFIVYIGGSAFASALGRLGYGLVAAMASRYTTSTLLAWIALLLWMYARLPARFSSPWPMRSTALVIYAISLAVLLPYQFRAITSPDLAAIRITRERAALAMALGIRDAQAISLLHFSAEYSIEQSQRYIAHGLGVHGQPPYALLAKHQQWQTPLPLPESRCSASAIELQAVAQTAYWRINGQLQDMPHARRTSHTPRLIHIQQDGRIVGYALLPRPTFSQTLMSPSTSTPFFGYLRAQALDHPTKTVQLVLDETCSANAALPAVTTP
ncbi:hypothetical protein CK623_00105 [Vandammella animalimorsus]|uniref:Uncharacterized protein n=2 Tax=Vandammella animalimorsus TaxID=2029117 RepID=A0A2A2AUP9_9BURK|nr:hypothetical protein CK623_00105 [Vandammella animalimorsus]